MGSPIASYPSHAGDYATPWNEEEALPGTIAELQETSYVDLCGQ